MGCKKCSQSETTEKDRQQCLACATRKRESQETGTHNTPFQRYMKGKLKPIVTEKEAFFILKSPLCIPFPRFWFATFLAATLHNQTTPSPLAGYHNHFSINLEHSLSNLRMETAYLTKTSVTNYKNYTVSKPRGQLFEQSLPRKPEFVQ